MIIDEKQVEALRSALEDCKSHRFSWSSALNMTLLTTIAANKYSPERADADSSYWDYEINAFNRTFDALQNLLNELGIGK